MSLQESLHKEKPNMSEILHTENPNDFELSHYIVPGEAGRDHIEEMAEAFVIEFKEAL